MASWLLKTTLQAAEVYISGLTLAHASVAIPNLQKWESKSQRASKYSTTVANEIQRTRITETIGVCASLFSIFTSFFLLLGFVSSGFRSLLLSLTACGATASASVYLGDFWDAKGTVPMVKSYNEGVMETKKVRGHLALLGILWGFSVLLECFY